MSPCGNFCSGALGCNPKPDKLHATTGHISEDKLSLILLKTQLTVALCLAEDHFYTVTDAQQLCMHKGLYESLDDVNYSQAPHTVMGCIGPLQPGYTAAWLESMQ